MTRRNAAAPKRGAPRKAPDGLDKVLFIRADDALIEKLEQLRDKFTKEKGVVVSRSDLVRKILNDAIENDASNGSEGK